MDDHTLRVRVWERGSGETLACGTGSTAALAVTARLGKCGDEADVILRGIRDASDLPLEMQMATANRQIGGLDTVFLACSPVYSLLSSSIVRDCARHGAPIESMVPEQIVNDIYAACVPAPDLKRSV